jgi:prolipoprotein diacylglyceryl transferase
MEFAADHIQFGNAIQVRYYGIIIVTAMLIAAWIASRLAERTKRDPDHIWGALTWAIFPGIVFARLWYILLPTASLTAPCEPNFIQTSAQEVCMNAAWFLQNFFNLENGAIAVWNGGLHIYGAVIGGLLGAWLYFGPLHHPVAKFFHILFGILPGGPVIVGLLYPYIPPQLFYIWLVVFVGTIIVWLWPYLENFVKMARARQLGDEVPGFSLPKYESTFPAEGMSILPWLDIAGVVLPLAQAIGRWANYVNQELYGIPTTLPWGISIDAQHRVGIYRVQADYPLASNPTTGAVETRFHPLFLYEFLWNLLAFFVLLNLYNRNRNRFRQGDFFLMYIAQYGFIRFLLEFLRAEPAIAFGVNSSQVLALVMCVVALIVLFVRFNARRGTTEGGYEQPAPATDAA